jgi:uncharacterized membrane protein YciS (DUF1049 family)
MFPGFFLGCAMFSVFYASEKVKNSKAKKMKKDDEKH